MRILDYNEHLYTLFVQCKQKLAVALKQASVGMPPRPIFMLLRIHSHQLLTCNVDMHIQCDVKLFPLWMCQANNSSHFEWLLRELTVPPSLMVTSYHPDIVIHNFTNNYVALLELPCPLDSTQHLEAVRDCKQSKQAYLQFCRSLTTWESIPFMTQLS